MKTVVLEKDRTTRPIDEIDSYKIYATIFGKETNVCIASRNKDDLWTFVSLDGAYNSQRSCKLFSTLSELLEYYMGTFKHKVYEFDTVEELAQAIIKGDIK